MRPKLEVTGITNEQRPLYRNFPGKHLGCKVGPFKNDNECAIWDPGFTPKLKSSTYELKNQVYHSKKPAEISHINQQESFFF